MRHCSTSSAGHHKKKKKAVKVSVYIVERYGNEAEDQM